MAKPKPSSKLAKHERAESPAKERLEERLVAQFKKGKK